MSLYYPKDKNSEIPNCFLYQFNFFYIKKRAFFQKFKLLRRSSEINLEPTIILSNSLNEKSYKIANFIIYLN